MENLIYAGKSYISEISPHEHTAWEIMYYRDGFGVLQVNNESFNIEPGLIVCIPPGMVHSEKCQSPCLAYFLGVNIFESSQEGIPVYNDSKNKEFFFFFDQLVTIINSDYENKLNVAFSLFETLSQYFEMRESVVYTKSKTVKKIVDIILKELQNPYFSLGETIGELNVHPSNFRKRFKKEMGVSPNRYLLQKRIDLAQQLIKTSHCSGLSIKKIANMSGFLDPYYFSKAYKKMTGISPSNDTKDMMAL